MPHKYNADRRHHIPRPKRRVTNWSEYNEALRQRGSLTVWFTDEAPRNTPGGQPHYSDLAITTALTLRAVFHLPLRQTEGLIGSILQLLGLDRPVPEPARASAATSPPSADGLRAWNCRRSPARPAWKQVIGDGLRFHSDEARATEVAIAAQVLNRMLDLGCPNSVRVA